MRKPGILAIITFSIIGEAIIPKAFSKELGLRDVGTLVSSYLNSSLKRAGYKEPKLLLALPGDRIPSGCQSRRGSTEVYGSHYCPKTQTVVLEIYELETLRRKFGDGAVAYAIAHEYSHYIQDQLGINLADPYNELHADCMAGALLRNLWATPV